MNSQGGLNDAGKPRQSSALGEALIATDFSGADRIFDLIPAKEG